MDSTKSALKQLKIKTGSLNRNVKDYLSYVKEKVKQEEALEKLKLDCDDEGKIRQGMDVIADTIQMLPNCQGRINGSVEDLKAIMEDNAGSEAIIASEEWAAAQACMAAALAFLEYI